MTYGEEVIYKRDNEMYSKFGGSICVNAKPMDRESAIAYYNSKLYSYWMNNLDERIPSHKKRRVLKYLMENA